MKGGREGRGEKCGTEKEKKSKTRKLQGNAKVGVRKQ